MTTWSRDVAEASRPDAAVGDLREHVSHLAAIDQWYWWHRVRFRVVRWCLRRFGSPTAHRHVDIGAGGGGLARFLSEEGVSAAAVLVDQYAIDVQRLGLSNARSVQMDLEHGQWEGIPTPDLVTCLDVLEHLRHPQELLRRMRAAWGGSRVLLIATVPAMPILWSSWDVAAGHRRRYTRRTLETLLTSSGWSVRFCGYFFHGLVLPALIRRLSQSREPDRLEFPAVPRWLNTCLEHLGWAEFVALRGLCLPFGSSLIVVASPSPGRA